MSACPTCGAERHRIGVLYPARRLCKCERGEARKCHCGKPAVGVEFQAPVRGDEPSLPATSDKVASFFCKNHCPDGFTLEAPPRASAASSRPADPDARDEAVDAGDPRLPKKGKRLPHVDPVWARSSPDTLPPGADSRQKVECVECHDQHEMRTRRMFNGSYSYCPRCGETMFIPVWD